MTGAPPLPDGTRPTRILLVASLASSLRNFRGPLIKEMRTRGHEVHVAAPGVRQDAPTLAWLDAVGATAHDITLARTGISPTADLKSLWQLYRLMRQIRPTLFLGYTIKPVIWGLVAARLAQVPRRVALVTGLGYALSEKTGGKHALIKAVARWLYALALRQAHLVFFQNPDDPADMARLGMLPAKVPVTIVNGSGVDLGHFPRVAQPEFPLQFLLIARLLGQKGVREFATAAAMLAPRWPGTGFHLVGGLDSNPDGIERAEIEQWVRSGHILWHGELADVRPALAAAHIVVLPSYREGTPRTLLEAMATGRAILTTDAPGCRETVADERNGFLVPTRDATALARAMERFLTDPDLAARMGTVSYAMAVEKYDVHKINAAMLAAMDL